MLIMQGMSFFAQCSSLPTEYCDCLTSGSSHIPVKEGEEGLQITSFAHVNLHHAPRFTSLTKHASLQQIVSKALLVIFTATRAFSWHFQKLAWSLALRHPLQNKQLQPLQFPMCLQMPLLQRPHFQHLEKQI